MDVAVVSGRSGEYQRLLRDHGIFVVAAGAEMPTDAAVLLADPPLVAGRLHEVPSLRWVQSTWAGVDALVEGGLPDHVVVTKVVGLFAAQMREFVFGHLLAHTQGVHDRRSDTRWNPVAPGRLRGARLGIVGTGSIGRALADTGRHFGMSVAGCNRTGHAVPGFDWIVPIDRLADLAAESDHLVAVLPATPATRGVIGRDVLAALPRGSTFINVGRGSTVDGTAVLEAVASERLGMAVLDVTEPEPLPPEHPLWQQSGVVITSHVAAISRPDEIVGLFCENLERFTHDRPLVGIVDHAAGY